MNTLNFPGIKRKWLMCFLEVSKTLNISKAADQLSLTSRSLIRNLQALENKLATRLFIYSDQDEVVLLAEGIALLRLLNPITEQIEAFQELRSQDALTYSQELSIGWCSAWPIEVLPKLLEKLYSEFSALYPRIDRCTQAQDLEQRMIKGEFALGLSCRPPQDPLLSGYAGRATPYVIAGLPQALRPWHELSYVASTHQQRGSIHGPWDDLHYPRQIVMRVESFSGILDIATSGLAAAWLPLCLVSEFFKLQQMAMLASPPQEAALVPYVIWRSDQELTPLVLRARSLLEHYIESELAR
jgi:DNA-binding transcriptional LysR family regulator